MKRINIKSTSLSILLATGALITPTIYAQNIDAPTTAQANSSILEANKSAAALISRVIPDHAQFFKVDSTLAKVNGQDTFSLSDTPDGKILLQGNNGVSIASALNWYLKNRVNCHLSWCGDQLNLPKELPIIGEKVTISTPHQERVYFNYCTLNYTCSWWDWESWEREVDFMAMNGINMPLGVVGLEGVWYHTLLKFGFTDLEARTFLVGPAHLAWQWMTNIQGKGSALPKEWIDKHIILGRKLLDRQRSLGMTPIQQGFTGFVPRELKKKFPKANIVKEHSWCAYEGTAQLDPLDPLFEKFGTEFLKTQIKLFGTSHVYAADPFHEGHPPKPGKEYLSKVGKAIYKLISDVDPKATIAMQSWSIRKEICEAFPKEHLVVLDLSGRRSDFWGYRYVKGQLHNFGGRINIHGDLNHVAENPFAAAAKSDPLCSGMGLFPEALDQNPVFYNMVLDMVWRDSPVQAEKWLNKYAERRYGKKSENAEAAWKLLLAGPYSRGTSLTVKSSIIAARPALIVKKSGPNRGFEMPYKPSNLLKAWQLLLADHELLKDSKGYQFDVADVGRQVLSNLGQELHKDVKQAFDNKDIKEFKIATERFTTLLKDVDTLLSPIKTHHLGKWLADARSCSEDIKTQDYYEKNAAMLVTIWGPAERPLIFDYSWREWSGLIKHYYLPRWEMFHNHLEQLILDKKEYSDPTRRTHGREALRANAFYNTLANWEIAWNKTPRKLDNISSLDPVEFSLELSEKYAALVEEKHNPNRHNKKRLEEASKLGDKIGSWTPDDIKETWNTVKIDVTEQLLEEGEYLVSFLYLSGGHRLDINSVRILKNGEVISSDKHSGFAGTPNKNNQYKLQLKEVAFSTKYEIQMKIRSNGGTNSNGNIYLLKK